MHSSSARFVVRAFGGFILAMAMLCPPAVRAADVDCTPQKAVDVTKVDRQIVLVGEVHGTAEIPRFALGLVCSFLAAGKPVILGLEHTGEQQAELNRYLRSAGTADDRRALFEGVNWSKYQDGRGSVAMFDLVEGMRRLRGQGRDVALFAIDAHGNLDVPQAPGTTLPPLPPADNALLNRIGNQSMANNVLYTAALYRDHVVIVLAGYSHTSTVPVTGSDPYYGSYVPMGALLTAQGSIYGIGIETVGGEAWTSGPGGARAHPLDPGPLYEKGAAVDARVPIGRLTASPPARDTVR
jgi:hypothetical protein